MDDKLKPIEGQSDSPIPSLGDIIDGNPIINTPTCNSTCNSTCK